MGVGAWGAMDIYHNYGENVSGKGKSVGAHSGDCDGTNEASLA